MTRLELLHSVREISNTLGQLADYLGIEYEFGDMSMQTNDKGVLVDVLLVKVKRILNGCGGDTLRIIEKINQYLSQ